MTDLVSIKDRNRIEALNAFNGDVYAASSAAQPAGTSISMDIRTWA